MVSTDSRFRRCEAFLKLQRLARTSKFWVTKNAFKHGGLAKILVLGERLI